MEAEFNGILRVGLFSKYDPCDPLSFLQANIEICFFQNSIPLEFELAVLLLPILVFDGLQVQIEYLRLGECFPQLLNQHVPEHCYSRQPIVVLIENHFE